VAARALARREEDEPAARDAPDLALGDAQLRRVDEVVGGVHRDERSGDARERRPGVVVARRLQRVEHVVRVGGLHEPCDVGVEGLVRRGERRRLLLPQRGVRAHEPQHLRRGPQGRRLLGVVAAAPRRIAADRVGDDAPPGAVPAGDLRREARERHERVDEVRMLLAPEPGVHPAHRRPEDEPHARHAQPLDEEPPLRLDHVAVAVAREARVEPVARLRRPAVPDAVGQHDEEARRVERLPRPEQLARELGADELRAAAGRAVQDEHRVHDAASRVAPRRPHGAVMDAQVGERLT
jgi:hypothetical protein